MTPYVILLALAISTVVYALLFNEPNFILLALLVVVVVVLFVQVRDSLARPYALPDDLRPLDVSTLPHLSAGERRALETDAAARRIAEGTHEGTPYFYLSDAGGTHHLSSITICIEAPGAGQFSVTARGAVARLVKRIGLSRSILTGDRTFDEAFYVRSDAPAFAAAVLRSPERRQAIREIFGSGFTSVRHDGASLAAAWSPAPSPKKLSAGLLTTTVSRLAIVAKDLPVEPRAHPGAFSSSWSWLASGSQLLFLVPGVILVGLLLLYEQPKERVGTWCFAKGLPGSPRWGVGWSEGDRACDWALRNCGQGCWVVLKRPLLLTGRNTVTVRCPNAEMVVSEVGKDAVEKALAFAKSQGLSGCEFQ